jgi:hypothetical protein
MDNVIERPIEQNVLQESLQVPDFTTTSGKAQIVLSSEYHRRPFKIARLALDLGTSSNCGRL